MNACLLATLRPGLDYYVLPCDGGGGGVTNCHQLLPTATNCLVCFLVSQPTATNCHQLPGMLPRSHASCALTGTEGHACRLLGRTVLQPVDADPCRASWGLTACPCLPLRTPAGPECPCVAPPGMGCWRNGCVVDKT